MGRPLAQALDGNGYAIAHIPQFVDASIIKRILEGSVSAFEIEGEIYSRDRIMKDILASRVTDRILLEPVTDEKGETLASPGEKAGKELTEILSSNPRIREIVVRPAAASRRDEKIITQRVTFVRKLREAPRVKPFIHGITKAALATDSFLSAASFQQTAQVLAQAPQRRDRPSAGPERKRNHRPPYPGGHGAEKFREIRVEDQASRKKR